MISIGEFSKICGVSPKTLRYYAEIGLILPVEINQENGYRYYAIEQLETMLLINRLKSYYFSLEEIKIILETEGIKEEQLYGMLYEKKNLIGEQIRDLSKTLEQLNQDLHVLKQGKSILSYLEKIDVQLTEVPGMNLLFVRKLIRENAFEEEYVQCFGTLFRKIEDDKLTMAAPPMVLFHSEEFSPLGLDTEFAVPVVECVKGTRDFCPGLCLKTVLQGSYTGLTSVYAKQREWAEKEGYESSNALFEIYVTDPSQVSAEKELITEIYYPVRKK